MKHNDILKYLDLLSKHSLANRVNDIVRDILPNVNDVDYGKRFISKKEFIKDFNRWLDTTFIGDEYNFGLNVAIPDDGIVSVKLFNVRWVHPSTGDIILYYIWAVQIYKDLPVLQIGDRVKKAFGLAKVGTELAYSDNFDEYSTTVNVGVVLYGDKSNCGDRLGHIIQHEIVHFVLNCIKHDANLPKYPDSSEDEFTAEDIDELLADIIPYYISWLDWPEPERTDRVLDLFKRDLYVKFNPEASSLYDNIITYLLGGGVL